MKRIRVIALVVFAVLCLLSSPLPAADFGPIFPKQAAPVVASPNFTWASGDYDFFVLYLLLPIPGYYYQPIPVPRYLQPHWRCPDALWDYLPMDGWCLWVVLGINTTTSAYEVTSWQAFQKVTDCVVALPDANLESYVRDEIFKPTGHIMASDLTGLTELYFNHGGVSDISGLEYAVDLTGLSMMNNSITDLSPVAALVNLTLLSVAPNPVTDLSPLAGLVNVTRLTAAQSPISDIQPLADLVNLTWLNIKDNEISDISVLAGMVDLGYLNVSQNEISDLTPLVGLGGIGELDLGYNQITDIYPLVQNPDMDPGNLSLRGNSLDATSCTTYIPELEARGCLVEHDCP